MQALQYPNYQLHIREGQICGKDESCDSVEAQNKAELRYPQELLNSVEARASLPDNEIKLKKGFIVMLLRNIKPFSVRVNGMRYVIENITLSHFFVRFKEGSEVDSTEDELHGRSG